MSVTMHDMLSGLAEIAGLADFDPEDGAMDLGALLCEIQAIAEALLAQAGHTRTDFPVQNDFSEKTVDNMVGNPYGYVCPNDGAELGIRHGMWFCPQCLMPYVLLPTQPEKPNG